MSLPVESGSESTDLGGQPGFEPFPDGDAISSSFAYSSNQPADTSASQTVQGKALGAAPFAVTTHRHGLLQASQSLGYIVIVALFIMTFTLQPFRIPSASMEPTLLVGDFLLVNKQLGPEASPRIFPSTSMIRRGDLIVFHYPVDSSLHLVKRVIGLPGDRLRLSSGHVFIDGNVLSEPYAVYRPAVPDSYRDDFPRLVSADPGVASRWWIEMRSLVSQGELTVPADSYFVLGDNRNDSEDSRYWGLVPRAAIVGKPLLVYFSLNDSGSKSGEASAADMPGNGTARHEGLKSFADFARWNRTLRILH